MVKANSIEKSMKFPDKLTAMVLIGPIFAGLLRKALPGQPVQVEALPLLAALAVGLSSYGIYTRTRERVSVSLPIAIWAIVVGVYSIPAFLFGISLGFQAAVMGVGVCLVGLSFVQSSSRISPVKIELAVKIFVFLMALQIIPGGVMLLYGNNALPDVFRANAGEIAIGKEFRIGQSMLAGYFTTAAVNAVAALCAVGMAATLYLRELSSRSLWRRFYPLLSMLCIVAVIWMTARRGVLLVAIAIVLATFVVEVLVRPRQIFLNGAVCAVLAVALLWLVVPDLFNSLLGDRVILLVEGQLNMQDRFDLVFLNFLGEWIERSPFGNFTGYASGVGKAFDVRDLNLAAEVGAAMLVAEQGVIGMMCFVTVFLLLQRAMFVTVRRTGQWWLLPIVFLHTGLFVLFFFKENSVLFPGLIGSLVYWSIPGMLFVLVPRDIVIVRRVTGSVDASGLTRTLGTHVQGRR